MYFSRILVTFIITFFIGGAESFINLETEFFLYTKDYVGREALFTRDRNSIRNSRFDPCRKTAFLITGWFQPRGDLRMVTFAETLASNNFNAFLVDFYTYDYFLSPLIAGGDIAKFMRALVEVTGVDPKSLQLLGISMGVHVAGQASRQFRVGRITALDPSGPFYELLPRFLRLDTTDADFVEAIHSSLFLGSVNPYVGHVNYVINDAITQPGCPAETDPNTGLELCYHLRAAYLYLASVDKCTVYFRECGSYIAFRLGLCRDRSTLLLGFGLDAKVAPRTGRLYWYSTDRSAFPYCNPADQIPASITTNVCQRLSDSKTY